MATYYVETAANGGGDPSSDGSVAHPWLWDEFVVEVNAGIPTSSNSFLIGPSTSALPHAASSILKPTDSYLLVYATDSNTKPIVRAVSAMDSLIDPNIHGCVVHGLELDGAGLVSHTYTAPGAISTVSDCILRGSTNNLIQGNSVYLTALRCELHGNPSSGSYAVIQGGNSISPRMDSCLITGCDTGVTWNTYDMQLSQCVIAGNDKGVVVSYPATLNSGNVIAGNNYDVNGWNGQGRIDDCIVDKQANNTTSTWSGPKACSNFLTRAIVTPAATRDFTRMDATSPFIDATNLDFRLTTAAQTTPYIEKLVRFMFGIQRVPGIVLNTPVELAAMLASPTPQHRSASGQLITHGSLL